MMNSKKFPPAPAPGLENETQPIRQDDVQGGHCSSLPPLKEAWPKAGEVNNLRYLKPFRKQLRNNPTLAEAALWKMLKGKKLEGRKFRRQFSVGNFILDFYCPSEFLGVELDGEYHYHGSRPEYDRRRDRFILDCGIKLLRFENNWVWENPEGLLEEIKKSFGWRSTTPQSVGQLPSRGSPY